MANCNIANGLALGCSENNTGSLSKIYLSTWSGSTTYSVDADNVITGITSFNPFYEVAVKIENADLASTGEFNDAGANLYTSVLNVSLMKYSKEQRDFLLSLQGTDIVAIVKTTNDDYLMIGKNFGARLTSASITTGRALTDKNGLDFVLTAKDKAGPQFVNSSVITTIAPTSSFFFLKTKILS